MYTGLRHTLDSSSFYSFLSLLTSLVLIQQPSASLDLKQLGDVSLCVSVQVCASMCVLVSAGVCVCEHVCEAMLANRWNPVSEARSTGICREEKRSQQQAQPNSVDAQQRSLNSSLTFRMYKSQKAFEEKFRSGLQGISSHFSRYIISRSAPR